MAWEYIFRLLQIPCSNVKKDLYFIYLQNKEGHESKRVLNILVDPGGRWLQQDGESFPIVPWWQLTQRLSPGQYIENTIILNSRVLSTKWKSVTFPL